jgi:hypothetical protein
MQKRKKRHQQECALVKREVMSLRVHVLRGVKMQQFKKAVLQEAFRALEMLLNFGSRFPQSRALIEP